MGKPTGQGFISPQISAKRIKAKREKRRQEKAVKKVQDNREWNARHVARRFQPA